MNFFRLLTGRWKQGRWAAGILAGLAVVVVTLIPQVSLWVERGREWQGSYAITDIDELVYSAYLNALINNKPRRTDPFLGSKGAGVAAQQETYFSIQFLPPYLTAFVARTLGLSASSAFILITPLVAFSSAMAVFWLLLELTGDKKASAIGVLLILLCGVLASANLITAENNYAVFSFLRRYIPAVAFPLFFVFCLAVLRAFTRKRTYSIAWLVTAGAIFAVLVYSYFFLWSAAAAWLFCITVLWLVARPDDRPWIIRRILIIGAMMAAALIPYFRLLTLRAPTIDSDQALIRTHAPELFSATEGLGALILLALAWGVWKKRVDFRNRVVLFAASCAFLPFFVFNQQIVTGRSLQPFHYEQFIINYLVLLALVVTDFLLLKVLLRRPVFSIAMTLVIGIALALKTSSVYAQGNWRIDEAIPLFKKIDEEAARNPTSGFAVFDRTILSASAPSNSSSLPLLWSPYSYTYGSVSTAEDNERLFQYFYYMGVDEQKAEKLLSAPVFRAAFFGLSRVNRTLTSAFEPVTAEEIKIQVAAYGNYQREFSSRQASLWPLSYVVLTHGQTYDLSNLDRWYERDGGERFGTSTVYRVRLRPLTAGERRGEARMEALTASK